MAQNQPKRINIVSKCVSMYGSRSLNFFTDCWCVFDVVVDQTTLKVNKGIRGILGELGEF